MLLMTALHLVHVIHGGAIDGVEQGPEAEDVKAGWVALAVFLMLCAAVALLGVSLFKQLRKAQAAKDAGVYGDEPVTADDPPRANEPHDATTDAEDPPRG